ncbi:hypothetical protein ACFLQV_01500 [Calditrichota bacterium]
MLRKALLLTVTLLTGTLLIMGCDTTANRELQRAEKALDEALDLSADAYASDDYMAAEELLMEAEELANDNRIQEARQAAIKAKLRAEESMKKAQEYHRIMEDEADRLGR